MTEVNMNSVPGVTPFTFAPDHTGKANAVAGIYTVVPAAAGFWIGAMIVTLNPTKIHIAVDTTGDKIADSWVSIPSAVRAETQPTSGDDDGS